MAAAGVSLAQEGLWAEWAAVAMAAAAAAVAVAVVTHPVVAARASLAGVGCSLVERVGRGLGTEIVSLLLEQPICVRSLCSEAPATNLAIYPGRGK